LLTHEHAHFATAAHVLASRHPAPPHKPPPPLALPIKDTALNPRPAPAKTPLPTSTTPPRAPPPTSTTPPRAPISTPDHPPRTPPSKCLPPLLLKFLLTDRYRYRPLLPEPKKASSQGFLTLVNHQAKKTRLQAVGLPKNLGGFVEAGWAGGLDADDGGRVGRVPPRHRARTRRRPSRPGHGVLRLPGRDTARLGWLRGGLTRPGRGGVSRGLRGGLRTGRGQGPRDRGAAGADTPARHGEGDFGRAGAPA
jgi:hypothetical protein